MNTITELANIPTIKTDVLIVGAGIAGLYTALNVNPDMQVMLISKTGIDDSASLLAQGGISAAIAPPDTPQYHYEDTITAGMALNEPDAVRVLVDDGSAIIQALLELNVPFDLAPTGAPLVTLEGGHRYSRVVHAGGDAIGAKTVETLVEHVRKQPNVTIQEHMMLVDLIIDAGRITGAIVLTPKDEYAIINASSVILAGGGIGQVYLHSTNPEISTGDAIAAAHRAGAALRHMEFVQFHPTGFYDVSAEVGARTFLISEALRGEGAVLTNLTGKRIMQDKHEMADLAPRDIVARAILNEMIRTGEPYAALDARNLSRDYLAKRFPTIYNECMRLGVDIAAEYIPVAPVQHYIMGGIRTDAKGATSLPGLYAVGECACTGVHGANRLASNSLLECLVFAKRAAADVNSAFVRGEYASSLDNTVALDAAIKTLEPLLQTSGASAELDADSNFDALSLRQLRRELQTKMQQSAGVIKDRAGMEQVRTFLLETPKTLDQFPVKSREFYELRNLIRVSIEIIEASLARTESVGSHYVSGN